MNEIQNIENNSFIGRQIFARINQMAQKTDHTSSPSFGDSRIEAEWCALFIDFGLASLSGEFTDDENEVLREYFLDERIALLQELLAAFKKYHI